jgi:hypothetical protein
MFGRKPEPAERPISRVTLFVPGKPASKQAWGMALDHIKGHLIDAEWVGNDGSFGKGFSFGTVSNEAVAVIDKAPGALVLKWSVDLRTGRQQIVSAVELLRDAGALAVRIEESKLGWEVSKWLELFSSDDPWLWHRGAVAFLSGATLQSCGMHAFSLPDVQLSVDGQDAVSVQELGSIFNVYQIAETPLLVSGQTFSPDAETPRRVVERWPDLNYPEDHACHNPYGVWRFGAPGGKARPVHDPAPVFIPELRVILTALQSKKGSPLTKAQVEATRDEAACIMMTLRDAQRLEQTRGRADLNPELVWEQWQALQQRGV